MTGVRDQLLRYKIVIITKIDESCTPSGYYGVLHTRLQKCCKHTITYSSCHLWKVSMHRTFLWLLLTNYWYAILEFIDVVPRLNLQLAKLLILQSQDFCEFGHW